jgi:hypothetical protein
MHLTFFLADADTVRRIQGELLEIMVPLIALLVAAILAFYFVNRWLKRARREESASSDQLSHYRTLYEQGEMSREEYESVRALLTGQLRKELNLPAPAAPAAPPADTNVQATPPDQQSRPPPEEPKA